MGFLQKLWLPGRGGNTPITSADLNRHEQGIADAFGTTQVVNGVQAISFQNLDGENDYGYDFTFIGRITGALTIDNAVLLRPNNDSGTVNYSATDMWRWFQDPLGTQVSGFQTSFTSPSGIHIGQSHWVAPGSLVIRARILAASGQKRVITGDYTFARGDADARHLRAMVFGHWSDTATVINRLDLAVVKSTTAYPAPDAGAVLSGRAVLRRLTV